MEKEERIKNYIDYGYNITRVYEETRIKYLELHIIFVSLMSVAISYFQTFLKPEGQYLIRLGIIILIVSVIINLIVSIGIFAKKTKKIERTNWHYWKNITKESKDFTINLDEENLIEDDKKQYRNLLIYQKRYFSLLRIIQVMTIVSVFILFIILIPSFWFINP